MFCRNLSLWELRSHFPLSWAALHYLTPVGGAHWRRSLPLRSAKIHPLYLLASFGSRLSALRLLNQYLSQFSTRSLGTRLNSRSFAVTTTQSSICACAAINMSLGPINSPRFSNVARSSP